MRRHTGLPQAARVLRTSPSRSHLNRRLEFFLHLFPAHASPDHTQSGKVIQNGSSETMSLRDHVGHPASNAKSLAHAQRIGGIAPDRAHERTRKSAAVRADVSTPESYASTQPGTPCALTDVQLVRRVIAGEPAAARQLVDTYAPLIQSAAARVLSRLAHTGLRRVPDIVDAVQEIFRQLWERDFARLRGYDEQRGTLAAFLWTLSQNEASKLAASGRRSGYREVPSHALTASLPGSSAYSDADEVEDAARRTEAKDALAVLFSELADELDATDRRIIELRFVEEQPSELICAELHISPAAFYQRVSRLRRLIQQVAARHGLGQPG